MPGLAHHPIDNLEPPTGFTQGCDDTHGCFRHPVAAAWGVSGGSQLELERLSPGGPGTRPVVMARGKGGRRKWLGGRSLVFGR